MDDPRQFAPTKELTEPHRYVELRTYIYINIYIYYIGTVLFNVTNTGTVHKTHSLTHSLTNSN
jgi:hypothetical protein